MSVHIKDVSLSFKSQDALQKVSLILSPHEITYILGPNGAGKSALVNCIAGLHTRYTGSISIPAGTKMGALTNHPFRYSFLSRSEEHTSELQSRENLVCRLLLEHKQHTIY